MSDCGEDCGFVPSEPAIHTGARDITAEHDLWHQLKEERACHDCREFRALWAGKLAAMQRRAEAAESDMEVAEEARRLAVQERDISQGNAMAAALALKIGSDRSEREMAALRALADANASGINAEHAEVERLQGELAGLRRASETAVAWIVNRHGDVTIVEILRAALAPQEGAEK